MSELSQQEVVTVQNGHPVDIPDSSSSLGNGSQDTTIQTHLYNAVLPAEGVALPGHHAVRGGRGGDRALLRHLRRHPRAQRAALARLRGTAKFSYCKL